MMHKAARDYSLRDDWPGLATAGLWGLASAGYANALTGSGWRTALAGLAGANAGYVAANMVRQGDRALWPGGDAPTAHKTSRMLMAPSLLILTLACRTPKPPVDPPADTHTHTKTAGLKDDLAEEAPALLAAAATGTASAALLRHLGAARCRTAVGGLMGALSAYSIMNTFRQGDTSLSSRLRPKDRLANFAAVPSLLMLGNSFMFLPDKDKGK